VVKRGRKRTAIRINYGKKTEFHNYQRGRREEEGGNEGQKLIRLAGNNQGKRENEKMFAIRLDGERKRESHSYGGKRFKSNQRNEISEGRKKQAICQLG